MTPEESPPKPSTPAEPSAARRAAPVWLMVLLFLLLWWGFVYFDQRSGWANTQVYIPYHSLKEVDDFQVGPPSTGARGKEVYENICGLCHNNDGNGKPNQAPPLAGSEWAQGTPGRMIRIPLVGLGGPVTVKGQEMNFPSSMPAMGAALSDSDLAAVLTYIRQSWGNKAPEITPEQVKTVRAEVGNRTQPWSTAELNLVQ